MEGYDTETARIFTDGDHPPPNQFSLMSEQSSDGIEVPMTGTVARSLAWKVLSVIVGQGCWYTSLLILAILVPPSAFGVIAVGTVITNLATLLLESGAGGALVIA